MLCNPRKRNSAVRVSAALFPSSVRASVVTSLEAYADESDRAAAVLAASFVEDSMRTSLMQHLVAGRATSKLLKDSGALGTFSALVAVSYAMGFLSPEMKLNLTLIRKIRNYFAHHPAHTTFKDQADRCNELAIATTAGDILGDLNARNRYILTISITVALFTRIVGNAGRRVLPTSERTG